MGLTPKDHTRATLSRMNLSGSAPHNLDRDNDAVSDDYGRASARSSDSSNFARGGGVKPHLGRPGRFSGGLIRTLRTDKEAAADQAEDAVGGRGEANAYDKRKRTAKLEETRENRARGGRTGKGKTVVNVVIGGDKPSPPVMAPPPPAPPPPPPPTAAPPRPPGGPGGMPMPMPIAGAPMGPAGAPPGGMPPMRARGGRVDGHHDFGKGGKKSQTTVKETYGSGGGKGRLEKAAREK